MIKPSVFALAILVAVGGIACRKRSQAGSAPVETPKAVAAPVANPAATPQRNAEEILGAMNEALRNYMAEKGKVPASIDELYVAHASKQLQPPPGKAFAINAKLMAVEYR